MNFNEIHSNIIKPNVYLERS